MWKLYFTLLLKVKKVQSIPPPLRGTAVFSCCLLLIGPNQTSHFCIFIGGISEENLFPAFLLPSPPSTVLNQICWWQILKATSSRQSRSNEVNSLCPDSHPPRRHTYTAHSEVSLIKPSAWIEPLAETHHLALINSLSQSVRGNPTFLFLLLLLGTSGSKRRCRRWTSHAGFLRALLLSLQPRRCGLSPRRNCMLAETIGLIEHIPQKVLGYSSLLYLIDDIGLTGLCNVIFITLLFEKWGIIQKVIHYLGEQEGAPGCAASSTIQ